MAGLIGCLVAVALLVHALTLSVKERRLRGRLRPVEARLIDPGRAGVISTADRSWADWQTQDLSRSIRDGHEPHTHLPTPASPTYTARWTYVVNGKTHHGEISLSSPVFSPGQIRFGRVQVFFDPENPSVSRPFPGAGDAAWAWFIAAGVAGFVGFLLVAIPNFDSWVGRAPGERSYNTRSATR